MAWDCADCAQQYNWDKVDVIVRDVEKTKFIVRQQRPKTCMDSVKGQETSLK